MVKKVSDRMLDRVYNMMIEKYVGTNCVCDIYRAKM